MRWMSLAMLVACNRSYNSGIDPEASLASLSGEEACELVTGGSEFTAKRLSTKDLCYISANVAATTYDGVGFTLDVASCEQLYDACAAVGANAVDVDICGLVPEEQFVFADSCDATVSEYEACIDDQVALLRELAGARCDTPMVEDAASAALGVTDACIDVLGGACAPGLGAFTTL